MFVTEWCNPQKFYQKRGDMDTAGIPGPIPVTPVIATTEQVCLTCFQNSIMRYLYTCTCQYMLVVYLIIFIFDINTLLQEHVIGIEDAKK